MNSQLMEHIEQNTSSFLKSHPDAIVSVTGDFNPASTGLKETFVKYKTGLTQIVKVLTTDTGTLDWYLTNRPKFLYPPVQLPKIGRSDHHAVLMKPCTETIRPKAVKKITWKRDLRESNLHAFGRWVTRFDWSCVTSLTSTSEKFYSF